MKASERWTTALKKSPLKVGVLPLLASYLASRLLLLGRLPVFFDESIFIRWSQLTLNHGEFMASLADGKLPLHRWLMVPFLAVFGDPLIGGRVAAVFCGAASMLLLILLGKEMFGWRTGLFAGLFYLVCPFCIWYDRIAITEGLLLTLFLLSTLIAVRCARKPRASYILLLGPALGLAMLTKGTALLLMLIVPFAYLARPRRARAEYAHPLLRWAVILALSYLIAFAAYNLLRFSELFYRIAARTAVATKGIGEVLSNPFDVFFTNAWTAFSTLLLFMTPLLLGMAIVGLAWGTAKRKRQVYFLITWVLVVWIVESLVSKHWMFDTMLPRFFLVITPPLLLGAARAVVGGLDAIKARGSRRKLSGRFAAVVGLVLVLTFPVLSGVLIITSPQNAPLPYWIRYQYITDWPSGWGMREIVDQVDEVSAESEVTVGSNLDGVGLPTDGLEMYLSENSDVTIVPFSYREEEFPDELRTATGRGPVYIAYNMFNPGDYPPEDWPVDIVHSYPKNGNENMRMFLLRVEGNAHQGAVH